MGDCKVLLESGCVDIDERTTIHDRLWTKCGRITILGLETGKFGVFRDQWSRLFIENVKR